MKANGQAGNVYTRQRPCHLDLAALITAAGHVRDARATDRRPTLKRRCPRMNSERSRSWQKVARHAHRPSAVRTDATGVRARRPAAPVGLNTRAGTGTGTASCPYHTTLLLPYGGERERDQATPGVAAAAAARSRQLSWCWPDTRPPAPCVDGETPTGPLTS